MRSRIITAVLAATAMTAPVAASAQSAGDVIVMRRIVTPPNVDRDANGVDQNQFHWETGPWSGPSSCGATVTQTRTVTCVKHRTTQPDASCAQPRPADSQTIANPTTCGHDWVYTAYTDTPSCGSVTNTRQAECRRSDGVPMPGACDVSTRESLSKADYDTRTCSYSWKPGDWSDYQPSTCSDAASRTRTEACIRSDNQPVDAALCASKPHNTLSEGPSGVYSSCAHAWSYGAWVSASTCSTSTSQTRTATCMRTINGGQTPVAESWCSATPKVVAQTGSDTSSCSTMWAYTPWSPAATSATCSASYAQTRTVTGCVAQLPAGGTTPVPDARCTEAKGALSQSPDINTGCGWSFNLSKTDTTTGWTAWSNTCGTATRTRTVFCRRSDAPSTPIDDTQCYMHGLTESDRPASTQTSTQNTDCTGKLVNGGFETTGQGWTLSAGAAYNTVNDPNNSLKAIHSGAKSIMMDSSSYGRPSVTQTFPTTTGGKYSVSYWAWAYGPQGIEAFVNNTSYGQVQPGCGNGCWLQKSFLFTAAGTTTTLKLQAYYSNYGYVGLDDVVVSQIP